MKRQKIYRELWKILPIFTKWYSYSHANLLHRTENACHWWLRYGFFCKFHHHPSRFAVFWLGIIFSNGYFHRLQPLFIFKTAISIGYSHFSFSFHHLLRRFDGVYSFFPCNDNAFPRNLQTFALKIFLLYPESLSRSATCRPKGADSIIQTKMALRF